MDTFQNLLLHAYSFAVDIDNVKIGFKSVRGIKMAMAFEALQVGGQNDGPALLPVPVKDGGKLVFELGVCAKPPQGLPWPGTPVKSISVSACNSLGDAVYTYTLEAPVVESIELGALDALSSEVLIETLTIAFRSIKAASGG